MPVSYELMNFDMGKSPAINEFTMGPYNIKLKPDYSNLYLQLSQNATTVTEYGNISNQVHKTVTHHDASVGSAIITATVTCNSEPLAVLISESFNTHLQSTGIWDLCIILSFLTGKRVFLSSDERRYRHVSHGEGSVTDNLIPKAAQIAWVTDQISSMKNSEFLYGIF